MIAAAAPTPEIVYEALADFAANGSLIHTDDTTMRVHSLRQEISEKEQARTGIFTTGLISRVGQHQIALFFTGQKHAGENFDLTLKRRRAGLDKPIHMCDGLLRNLSKEFETILCNCLCHGRRQVVDVAENFPEQSRKIIAILAEVYRVDAQAKEQQLSDADRLLLHQTQSKPLLDELRPWMQEQLDQKQVEPNSGLGQAINYLLRRWDALTRFLSVPGAPLDNNIAERALKMAILQRKNSLAFMTLRGARVGDVFMSLIHTCELNCVNPFDYLMALQQNAAEVSRTPIQWFPWNYSQALQAANTG